MKLLNYTLVEKVHKSIRFKIYNQTYHSLLQYLLINTKHNIINQFSNIIHLVKKKALKHEDNR